MSQSESDQPKSESVAQNQENILKDIQADNFNYAPVQTVTHIETQIIQEREEVTQRQLIKACPYKGLFKFNAGDKDKFFGRDSLIEDFLKAVNNSPLSLILGASGSGKSSVVRAGVIPKLKDSLGGVTFYDFIVEPREYPFMSLYNSFLNNEKDYQFTASDVSFLREDSSETLPRVIKQLKKADQYWLFFIDQFEQLFTNCSDVQMRENFIDGLVQVSYLRDSSVKIVLAMRSDFSESLSAYPALGKILNQNNNIQLVTDIDPADLRQVIEEPAKKHGVVFEKGLVEQIIKDLQGQKGSLPLLQYTLQLLWEEECRLIATNGRPYIEDRTLNTFNYNALEGVRGALQKHINKIYQDQNEEEKIATKQIFLNLVKIDETDSGTRAVSQVASISEFASESQQKVLRNLIDAKLLVSDDKYLTKDNLVISFNTEREKLVTVEVAHEILLSSWDILRRWLDEEKQIIILRNWLKDEVKRWEKIKKQDKSKAKDELVKGSRLDEIVAFRKADGFSKLGGLSSRENEYIDASVEYRDFLARQDDERRQREIQQGRERRLLLRRSLAGAVFAALCLFGVAQYAFNQKQRAEESTVNALTSALDTLNTSNDQLKVLKQSINITENLQKESLVSLISNEKKENALLNLHSVISTIQEYNRISSDRVISRMKVSPNGQIIAFTDPSSRINLTNLQGDIIHLDRRYGYKALVFDIAFSPDSKYLATGYEDNMIRIWTVKGELVKTLISHEAPINSLVYSPDGKFLVSGSSDTKLKLWDVEKGSLIRDINQKNNNDIEINAVDISRDGKLIAGAMSDETKENNLIKIWDMQGKLLRTIHSSDDTWIYDIKFSPDGKRLAAATDGTVIKIWQLNNPNEPPQILKGHGNNVLAIDFSEDGQILISGGEDKTVQMWDTSLGKLIKSWTNYQGMINSVQFFPKDRTIAIASGNNIHLWNPYSTPINRILVGNTDWVYGVSFSPDGQIIGTAAGDHIVRLWSREGALLRELKGHSYAVNRVSFSIDGKTVASASEDGTVKLWNIKTGELLKTLKHEAPVIDVDFYPTDPNKLVAISKDNKMKVWDINGNKLDDVNLGNYLENVTGNLFYRDLSFRADGKQKAVVLGKQILIWSDSNEKPLVISEKNYIQDVKFDPTGQLAIATGGRVKIFNYDFKQINTVELPTNDWIWISSIAFSPDNQKLATVTNDKVIVWHKSNNEKYEKLLTLKHGDPIMSIAFSPDSKILAVSGRNSTVNLWILDNLSLDQLLISSCNWLKDYLVHSQDDSSLPEKNLCETRK